MKNSFLIYNDYKEFFDILTDDQLGKILRAMMAYSTDKTVLELPLELRLIFIQIKQQMDRNEVKYEEICKRNQSNGVKGGRPKNPENPVGSLGTQNNPEEPRKPDKDKDKDKDKETINKIYTSYKELINKEARLTDKAVQKIKTRLKVFSLEDLFSSLRKFSANEWQMEHNSSRGIAWFFESDDRIDGFITTKPSPAKVANLGVNFNSLPIKNDSNT